MQCADVRSSSQVFNTASHFAGAMLAFLGGVELVTKASLQVRGGTARMHTTCTCLSRQSLCPAPYGCCSACAATSRHSARTVPPACSACRATYVA